VTIVVTLLLAALQALVGAWLARAFAPARTTGPERESPTEPDQGAAVKADPL
jgi:hypothetical protein